MEMMNINYEFENNEEFQLDLFVFGQTLIYCYDQKNHCLLISQLKQSLNRKIFKFYCYYLSSKPSRFIEKLILNSNETIIALICEKKIYFVDLFPLKDLIENQFIDQEKQNQSLSKLISFYFFFLFLFSFLFK